MRQVWMIALLTLAGGMNAAAQVELPAAFENLLQKTGVEVFYPVESDYKNWGTGENEWLNCEFAIRSRREKLEIRYHIVPYNEADPSAALPHLNCMRLLMHLASNDEEAAIAVHSLPEMELEENYRADWGKQYYFKPKRSFGDYAHCQLLALYREGSGMVYVFYFFDEPGPALEDRVREVRFSTPVRQR